MLEEINQLKIDRTTRRLWINGKEVKDETIIVELPGPEGWPYSFIAGKIPETPGRIDTHLVVDWKLNNKPLNE